jgi:hypothetical protein
MTLLNLRLAACGLVIAAAPMMAGQALAWGHTGHVSIGLVAADALPGELQTLLRPDDETLISEWNAELDVSKTTISSAILAISWISAMTVRSPA